ncbi:hypothetical protein [Isoalcanivorax indicus]|uniref:hypothetical protein n=1 Tax=Isoalcanivorax indicus TaxID=2202653 RepID=UPI0013C4E182|nr:hypothetical protein [Isoalcanivorax indicus]
MAIKTLFSTLSLALLGGALPVLAAAAIPDQASANQHMPALPYTGLAPLEDEALGDVMAQGLIVTDKISGTELPGSNPFSTPFTFYRMGLEGELELNMNISKLQLGCGGINDHLSGYAGCDIDIDYATLMGRDGTDLGDPMSAFVLKRPYIELAVRNDHDPALREVIGIKIGSQSADGALSIGRVYEQAVTNQENMLSNQCNPSASTGAGVVGCHSGINSVSGFLGAEMSLTMGVEARVCAGIMVGSTCLSFTLPLNATGCVGRTEYGGDLCGSGRNDAFFVDLAGTRMQSLGLRAAELDLTGSGITAFLELIGLNTVSAQLKADLRLLHKLTFEDTGDFFLSFQREPVAYPRYSKQTPIQEMIADGTMDTAFDACAVSGFATPRCNSAYAVPANTGWWLNAPSVKLLDVYNPSSNLGTLSIGNALQLLGPPGYLIENAEFALRPARNCYGSSTFC